MHKVYRIQMYGLAQFLNEHYQHKVNMQFSSYVKDAQK